jgi:hypothetical protein
VSNNLAGVCATHCGHLFVVVCIGAWHVTPSCVWLCTFDILVTSRRGRCVGMVDVVLSLLGVFMFVSGG